MPTIAAIATPPGQGGIGVIRISGPEAKEILAAVFRPCSSKFSTFEPWRMYRGAILAANGEILDEVLAVYMPAPRTFTGENVAEIHCHGGSFVLEMVLCRIFETGARQAERGEFSRRAFLNGRIDLSQAEAVAELIAAPSREAMRYGLKRLEGCLGKVVRRLAAEMDQLRALTMIGMDFPDDEVPALETSEFLARVRLLELEMDRLISGAARASAMQEGLRVVLGGPVNAGKSSLLNALAGRERALVTPVPGTTRDFIEIHLNLDGLPVSLIDCAGLRNSSGSLDPVESMGMEKSRKLLEEADLAVLVADGSSPDPFDFLRDLPSIGGKILLAVNKLDLGGDATIPVQYRDLPNCRISALSGENLDELAALMRQILLAGENSILPEDGVAPNRRQTLALKKASRELAALAQDLEAGQSYDCCLARLDTAAMALDEILGLSAHDDLLDKIFSQFCIGK